MMDSNPNYINQYDFDRIIAAIPTLKIRKWNDRDVEYLFKILYHMALRPIEGIKLSKEDFDIKNRFVYLGKTKTSNADKAIIPRIFEDELVLYLDSKEEGRLFPGLTYRTLWTWLKRLGKELDIDAWKKGNSAKQGEKTVGHIFRKSWGKDALNELGMDKIDIIAQHLRHKKPSMTFDHYLHANIEKVKSEI